MMSQLALFDSVPEAVQAVDWRSRIWSPAFNQAINATLIEACRTTWLTLADLAKVQEIEFGMGNQPLGCQLMFLVETRRLRVRCEERADGTFLTAWRAV